MADTVAGKAQAAREVCAASAAFASCTHRRRSPRRPPFVDWYLVLAIGEAASEDAVKRRYRHLVLQLHPDKNRHPKAEVAFKLVSEAHGCLTDKARRRAFDAERSTAFCAACHARLATRHRASSDKRSSPSSAPSVRQQQQQQAHSSGAKPRGGVSGRRPPAPTQALREVQNRLRDECRVIDDCLRANGDIARRRQSFPLFDPSDRQRYPDYPHARLSPFAGCRPSFKEELGGGGRCFPDYPHAQPPPVSPFAGCRPSFKEELGVGSQVQGWTCRGATGCCESPVYQARTAPERAGRTRRPW